MYLVVRVTTYDVQAVLGERADAEALAAWANEREPLNEDEATHLIRFRAKTLAVLAAEPGTVFDDLIVATAASGLSATLTGDGKPVWRALWCEHQHAAADDLVRYESYSERGIEAHGFVHAECRKLVQAG